MSRICDVNEKGFVEEAGSGIRKKFVINYLRNREWVGKELKKDLGRDCNQERNWERIYGIK